MIVPAAATPWAQDVMSSSACEFRFNPATDSDLMPAGVPI